MRRDNIGIRPSFFPGAMALDMPDAVWEHPLVRELEVRRALSRHAKRGTDCLNSITFATWLLSITYVLSLLPQCLTRTVLLGRYIL